MHRTQFSVWIIFIYFRYVFLLQSFMSRIHLLPTMQGIYLTLMPITLTARPSQHHKETVILVNVGSGNGFVLHDTRLLPRPVLINYQWGLVTSQEMLKKSLLDMNAKITHFRQSHLLRHKWVNTGLCGRRCQHCSCKYFSTYAIINYSMMASSYGNSFFVNGPYVRGVHRWPVDFPHKGQWCEALLFSLIYA